MHILVISVMMSNLVFCRVLHKSLSGNKGTTRDGCHLVLKREMYHMSANMFNNTKAGEICILKCLISFRKASRSTEFYYCCVVSRHMDDITINYTVEYILSSILLHSLLQFIFIYTK